MNRCASVGVVMVLTAGLGGGCVATTRTPMQTQAGTTPCLVAGDALGRTVFANDRRIVWAPTRPADAFAHVPGTLDAAP